MAVVESPDLSKIGRDFGNLVGNFKNPVEAIMAAFANDAIDGMRSNLSKHGIDSGSNLSQSIKPLPIEVVDNGVIMSIELADYWDYVNQGVNGLGTKWGSEYLFRKTAKVPIYPNKPNFVTSLSDWIFKKGINTFSFKTESGEYVTKPIQDEEDRERAAFGIMIGIKQKGIEPTYFVDDYFTDNKVDELTEELFQALTDLL